ncbi:MAG: hypothetical protein A2089_07370 [Elusimicrobia bacterium GWD2_63_28]|nr:MAG: hypothetical protein A2089_07370 [Elusimicrobia bacterium GWD2_63_28]
MTNTKIFAAALSRIRKDRGFPSAYKFFKAVGGSKALGMAFVSYWDIERGKKLPKSRRLNDIIEALGLKLSSSEGKALVKAYFTELSGSEELVRVITEPEAGPAGDTGQLAAQQALAQLAVTLTLEQARVMVRDKVTCFCFNGISETEGGLTPGELSDGFGFKPAEVRKALKALADCGLVEASGEKVRSRNAGRIVQLMPMTPETKPLRMALRGYYNEFVAQGRSLAGRRCMVRMNKAALEQYTDHLRKAVELAEAYGNPRETAENSEVYFIEGRVFHFFPK